MPTQSKEMKVLKEFVEEWSPIHRGLTKDMLSLELLEVVANIVKTEIDFRKKINKKGESKC